ncbi:hypothetical protein RUM44_004191 [Polyplax serrata]|uniref:Uncharacterized protein n=1 Tax=Polyplax serrata TaxID=468196 RepID=A0ABR1B250_POLSC
MGLCRLTQANRAILNAPLKISQKRGKISFIDAIRHVQINNDDDDDDNNNNNNNETFLSGKPQEKKYSCNKWSFNVQIKAVKVRVLVYGERGKKGKKVDVENREGK